MGNKQKAKAFVDEKIASDKVVVFSKSYCPFCTKAKTALNSTGVKYTLLEIEDLPDMDDIQDYLRSLSGIRSVSFFEHSLSVYGLPVMCQIFYQCEELNLSLLRNFVATHGCLYTCVRFLKSFISL